MHFDIDAESKNESIDIDVDEDSKFNPTVLKISKWNHNFQALLKSQDWSENFI